MTNTLRVSQKHTTPYTVVYKDLILDEQDKGYILTINDLPKEQKPREKLLSIGPGSLTLSELLAVVFMVGTKKEDVLSMSSRLLKEYGEKTLVRENDPKKIANALNLPLTKACQLVACFELGRRFYKTTPGKPEFLRTAKQVYQYLDNMHTLPKEHLRGLYLDAHYRLVHDEVISIGSLTANLIHPREVYKPAFDHGAVAVILAHNHPSGVAEPSDADLSITRQLSEAGKILGIHLLDHIIVTKNKFTSIPSNYN